MLHVPKESVIAASNVQNVMGDIMLLLSGAIEMSHNSQSTGESPSSGLKAESRRSALNLECLLPTTLTLITLHFGLTQTNMLCCRQPLLWQ